MIVEIERRVPARCCIRDCRVIPAFAARAFSFAIFSSACCISLSGAHDADQVLHHVLQFVLHRERILARRAALERRQRRLGRRIHLAPD